MACGWRKIHVMVISKTPRKKLRHKCPRIESDGDPLPFPRTLNRSCFRLRSTKGEKVLSLQVRDDHLEAICCHGKKRICTLAMAAPNLFDEGMIGGSVLEMDELALTPHGLIGICLRPHGGLAHPS